jgi:hypothetical protein
MTTDLPIDEIACELVRAKQSFFQRIQACSPDHCDAETSGLGSLLAWLRLILIRSTAGLEILSMLTGIISTLKHPSLSKLYASINGDGCNGVGWERGNSSSSMW